MRGANKSSFLFIDDSNESPRLGALYIVVSLKPLFTIDLELKSEEPLALAGCLLHVLDHSNPLYTQGLNLRGGLHHRP
jgi:hypothetical protein